MLNGQRGVPGIQGFLGQEITTTDGAIDPQTFLAPSTELDVIPNLTCPSPTAGSAEFQFADPVVALQGSGTADAPNLVFHVVTTGKANITVSYNLRDIDSTSDDAVQAVALQYRIGSTGDFTNVPAGYVADATTGPNLATQVTPVIAVLPADANNQPLVQVRVITAQRRRPRRVGRHR